MPWMTIPPIHKPLAALMVSATFGAAEIGAAQGLPLFDPRAVDIVRVQANEPDVAQSPGQAAIDGLIGVIQLDQMLEVMIAEELGFGEDLRADMLPDVTPSRWKRDLQAGLSVGTLKPIFVTAFAQALDGVGGRNAPLQAEIAALGHDPLMAKAIDLEVKARRLLLDIDVENAAFDHAVKSEKTARFKAVGAYIEALDLVENNVAGSLNSNLVFYREMVRGGAFPYDVTEQEMVSDVAGEADAMRAEIDEWLTAYLYMAYAPMSDAEFARFSKLGLSAAGRAFYDAANRGYDAVFVHNSKVIGAMVAGHLAGEAL